jgi:hypothetical protein
MSEFGSKQIGGIAGAVFAIGVLVFSLALVGDAPAPTDSTSDIREYFDDNGNRVLLSYWFTALLFFGAFLTFASALRSALASSAEDALWGTVALSAAVVTAALAGGGLFAWGALALDGTDGYSDSMVQLLMDIDALVYGSTLPVTLAVFLVAGSIPAFRRGALWTWLGWLGLLGAAALAIGPLWVLDGDPEGALGILVWLAGLMGALLWILLASIGMYRMSPSS